MTRWHRDTGNGLAWIAALAGAWLWTWWHLSVEWRLNEQYQYGYAVPWLAAGMAWLRLREMPSVSSTTAATFTFKAAWLIPVTFGVFLFGELLRQQDSTWRLVGWLMMCAVTLLTVGWLWRCGGSVLARQLAFPLAFTWLALPWPSPLEAFLTGKLMNGVTGLTVHLLNATGIAALQHGNVIELSRGWVGVDTACSGVQSVQASLVVALLLGELYRFKLGGRLALILAGALIAGLANLGRIYALTRLVQTHGEAALEQYHEPIGYAVTAGTFLTLFICAWWATRKSKPLPPPPKPVAVSNCLHLAGADGWAALLCLLLIPALAWSWFAFVPGEGLIVQRTPLWQINTNLLLPAGWKVTTEPLTRPERALLGFSEGQALQLRSPAGMPAHVFHFFWKPEASTPSMAFSHTPDVCLPSAGWRQVGNPVPVTLRHNGASFDFEFFRFRLGGAEQAVLYGNWFGGQPETFPGITQSFGDRTKRLAMLWTGPRRRGHEILTVFLPVVGDERTQLRLFEELLAELCPPAPAVK